MASESPDPAAGGDDSVIGKPGLVRLTKNVADRPRRPWSSRQSRDVAIRRYPADRNPAKDIEHAARERAPLSHQRPSASRKTRPFERGSLMPATDANVAAMSSGEAAAA